VIYLLDTNAISDLMRADLRMASWLSSIGPDDRVVICTITRGEILFGLERLAPGRRRSELEEKALSLFAVLPCEPIPSTAGDRYASVKVLNSAAGFRWMRTTSGLRRPHWQSTQRSLAGIVTSMKSRGRQWSNLNRMWIASC
jgi:PIN domain